MAHGKGSTGCTSDVLEAGQMAASLRKVPATASIMTTSREQKRMKGKMKHRVCITSKEGAAESVVSGN